MKNVIYFDLIYKIKTKLKQRKKMNFSQFFTFIDLVSF